jgi:D-glycero-D-manno-heptose 1,7-bisphosphate phosphatase
MSKIIFLDRDGIINVKAKKHEYIYTWEKFNFIDDIVDSLRILKKADFKLIIISNQRGISRGIMNKDDVDSLHKIMNNYLDSNFASIDGIYYCPHDKNECYCRKPNIGLFLLAEKDFYVQKELSFMIGDELTDIEAGNKYGVSTILIGKKSEAAKYVAKDIKDATKYILSRTDFKYNDN